MPNQWKIEKDDVTGGPSGTLMEGCEVRRKADGSGYELIAILAETHDPNVPVKFPPFAYRGLIWHLEIDDFNYGPLGNQPVGPWTNNAGRGGLVGDETGTWTAQAGSGMEEEVDGEEDAASASA